MQNIEVVFAVAIIKIAKNRRQWRNALALRPPAGGPVLLDIQDTIGVTL